MKQVFFIPSLLVSFSCFYMLERKMDKTIYNCRPFCTNYEISENEWCDCMYTCLNKGKIKWKLSECEIDSTNNP